MKENEFKIGRKGIYYPIVGLVSIFSACLFGTFSTGLNVHSGEIFVYILILFALGVITPIVAFMKSLEIVRFKLGEEESRMKTYTIILTYSLGTVLTGTTLFTLWVILK